MKIFTFKNKRHMPSWLAGILAFIAKSFSLTFRVSFDDPEGWTKTGEPCPAVIAIWHNRILFPACLIPREIRKRLTVLISASRDGEYVSAFIKFFGLNVVRGSSSRGGAQALVELIRETRNGHSVILTLDGPRGPKYTIHPGAVAISQKTGVPILPLVLNSKSYWQLKSWDRMQIPKPFTKLIFRVGKPIHIPADMPIDEAENMLKNAMLAITNDKPEPAITDDSQEEDI